MPIQINSIISALDKPTSLAPFFVKDAFDITGRTVMANGEGGKHEAREKFIEEAGTSMFWIGGIPATRWIGEKILKKHSNINTNIHFKRINSDGIQNYFADEIKINKNGAKKFSESDLKGINLGSKAGSKLEKIKASLKEANYIPNISKGSYKKAHVGLTAASVLTNLIILCVGLPKFNQYLSRKIIAKEHQENLNKVETTQQKDQITEKVLSKNKPNENKKDVSFGGFKDLFNVKNLFNFTEMAESAQLNVQSSMLLLDYGISGSRVTFVPRDNNERIENAVKEGGIILFFYKAGEIIKDKMALFAKNSLHTPIDLDYKVITDKNFINHLKTHTDKEELFAFAKSEDELDVIKFIDSELEKADTTNKTNKTKVFENFTLQEAQKAGLLDIEYDEALGKWIRHSENYIETDKVATLNKNLNEFWQQIVKNGESSIDGFISKTKKVKAVSVFANIAICCTALSFVLPKIQYKIREHRTKTSEAPGIKLYQELAAKKQLEA